MNGMELEWRRIQKMKTKCADQVSRNEIKMTFMCTRTNLDQIDSARISPTAQVSNVLQISESNNRLHRVESSRVESIQSAGWIG